MDRSLAIGGVLYEIISPSVRNVSLAFCFFIFTSSIFIISTNSSKYLS